VRVREITEQRDQQCDHAHHPDCQERGSALGAADRVREHDDEERDRDERVGVVRARANRPEGGRARHGPHQG
jgi:hypothetical protein